MRVQERRKWKMVILILVESQKNAILKRIYFFFLHEMYGLNMIKKIHINLNRYTFY